MWNLRESWEAIWLNSNKTFPYSEVYARTSPNAIQSSNWSFENSFICQVINSFLTEELFSQTAIVKFQIWNRYGPFHIISYGWQNENVIIWRCHQKRDQFETLKDHVIFIICFQYFCNGLCCFCFGTSIRYLHVIPRCCMAGCCHTHQSWLWWIYSKESSHQRSVICLFKVIKFMVFITFAISWWAISCGYIIWAIWYRRFHMISCDFVEICKKVTAFQGQWYLAFHLEVWFKLL